MCIKRQDSRPTNQQARDKIFARMLITPLKFDGTKFMESASTRVAHSLGAMGSFLGSPVMLGGIIYQAGAKSVQIIY